MNSDASKMLAAVATVVATAAAQYFGVTAPNLHRADANKAANFEARDALKQCTDRYMQHFEEDH